MHTEFSGCAFLGQWCCSPRNEGRGDAGQGAPARTNCSLERRRRRFVVPASFIVCASQNHTSPGSVGARRKGTIVGGAFDDSAASHRLSLVAAHTASRFLAQRHGGASDRRFAVTLHVMAIHASTHGMIQWKSERRPRRPLCVGSACHHVDDAQRAGPIVSSARAFFCYFGMLR